MRRGQDTRALLQAAADRYRAELRDTGFAVPSCRIRVFTDGSRHDAAIGAPSGFSARYYAVGARSNDGGLTAYIGLGLDMIDAPSPQVRLRDLIYSHATNPTALAANGGWMPRREVAVYPGGRAFVLERNPTYEAFMREYRLLRRHFAPWQTDQTPLSEGDRLAEQLTYPDDYAVDESDDLDEPEKGIRGATPTRHDRSSSGMHRIAPDKERT